jgi:hypothetical protein
MVPILFKILFILALTAPVFAVFIGLALLLVPTRLERTAIVHRHVAARV